MDPLRGCRRLCATYVKPVGPKVLFSIPYLWGVGKDVKVIKSGYKAIGGAILLVLLAISWLTGKLILYWKVLFTLLVPSSRANGVCGEQVSELIQYEMIFNDNKFMASTGFERDPHDT